MDTSTLLIAVQARGTALHAEQGKIVCRGKARLPGELVEAIREHRDELLLILDGDTDAAVDESVIEIDGRWFDRDAAELYRKSIPFSAAGDECRCCAGDRFWRLNPKTPWICARCHGSGRPAAEVEWRGEATPASRLGTFQATEASAPVDAGALQAGGDHRG